MKKLWWMIINFLILFSFAILYITSKNFEFLTYVLTLGILVYVLYKSDSIFKYPNVAKIGFSIWLFLHMCGGYFYIGQTKLYGFVLINLVSAPYYILRYDQILHFYSFFVISFFVYRITLHITKDKPNKIVLFLITVLGTIGVGALNETLEFSTVALFSVTGVGDYYNNALDLVFNLIGALLGSFLAVKYRINS